MIVFDTICALSTPPFKSALAIVRLSGNKSLDILLSMINKEKKDIIPNHSFLTKLYKDKNDPSTLIDECMVTFYLGPKSYTGYDSVDFFLHGNPIICDELLSTLVSLGARRALKGEFSAQAYFNSKFDLLKAQGINDLINATTLKSKNIALHTLKGKNTSFINEVKNNILSIIASLEYYIEDQYSDNDNEAEEEIKNTIPKLDDLITNIENNINLTKNNNLLYKGVNVSIIGQTNAGKSTLLNALIQKEKAIVSPIPGTTRDVVEGEIEYKGIRFIFSDTAGIRNTKNKIENLGIKKSYASIKDSDIVLLLSENDFSIFSSNSLKKLLKDKIIIKVLSKDDLKKKNNNDYDISISAKNNKLNNLMDLIINKLNLNLSDEYGYFLGKREEDYLLRMKEELIDAKNSLIDTYQIDIVSDKLRIVINTINELLGNHESKTMEDIYETLFSSFCLGK